MSDRPDFELTPYEDESLPSGIQLTDEGDLIGHTIKAVVLCPGGHYCDGTEVVIVTETMCWMVIEAESEYNDEAASVRISDAPSSWDYAEQKQRAPAVLHDFLTAQEMLMSGLIGKIEHDRLKVIESDRDAAKVAKRAEQLRKELAKLEGGAA